jgi:hypothetical protein
MRTLASFQLQFALNEAPAGVLARELGLGGTYAGKTVLLWREPSSLRLEPLSPLGVPLFVVVARGGSLRAYLPGRARFFEGAADAQSMARLFGVPIGSALFVRLLQGALPVAEGADAGQARLAWDAGAGALRLELPPGEGLDRRQVVWLDPDDWSPRAARLGEPGAEMEVRFGPFLDWGGARVPGWMEVAGPGRASRLRLEVPSPPAPPPADFPDSVFHLPVPPGVQALPLEGESFR